MSTRTEYGGVKAVLYWKKSEEETWGLDFELVLCWFWEKKKDPGLCGMAYISRTTLSSFFSGFFSSCGFLESCG